MHRLACLLALCVAAAPLRLHAASPSSPTPAATTSTATAKPTTSTATAKPTTSTATASPTAAASLPILVWPPRLDGIAGDQAADSIHAALRAGLTRAELMQIAAPAEARDCDDAECRQSAARSAGADHLVTLQVRAIDRDFEVRVQLVDTTTGETRELVEGCSICGLDDACALVESLGARLGPLWRTAAEEAIARRLQEQALQQQPRLRITTNPPGAAIFVDGQKVGVTPLEAPLAVGRHTVELRRDDYLAETREVNLSRGVVSKLTVPLRADGKLPPSARSRALLISGSVLLGLGVGGLAVMGAGLGRGAAAERDGAAKQEQLAAMGITGLERTDALADLRARGQQANTMASVGAVLGGVLLIAGVTLVAVSTTNRARRLAVAPWGHLRGAGISLTGRF